MTQLWAEYNGLEVDRAQFYLARAELQLWLLDLDEPYPVKISLEPCFKLEPRLVPPMPLIQNDWMQQESK